MVHKIYIATIVFSTNNEGFAILQGTWVMSTEKETDLYLYTA